MLVISNHTKNLRKAIEILENCKRPRDLQALEDYVPAILDILKCAEIEISNDKTEYYAPSWVAIILERLHKKAKPLSKVDYLIFASLASSLSEKDFKPASYGMFGYTPIHIEPENIGKTISDIKKYFHLI